MANSKAIKAGLGYTIGNICIKGISFITLPIFARLLTTSDYGIYNTYMAYEAIVCIILGLGMYSSVKNAKSDFPEKLPEYVYTQIWITTGITAIIVIICILGKNFIADITGFSSFIILLLVLQSFGSAMLSILNAKLALDYNYKCYLYYAVFNTLFNVILSISLVMTIMNNNRSLGRILGSAIPMIIIGVFIFITEGKKTNFKFNTDMAKYALAFGVPLIWHFISQQIASQFDRIMITNIVGVSYTGIYSFVYTIANILQIIFYSTDNVWSVWFFKQMDEKNYQNIQSKTTVYIILIALVTAIMMLGSREVIMIMGPEAYWEGVNVFIPIIIGIFLLFLYTMPVGIEYYFKETKYIAITTFVSALVNVILNYLFIGKYGYIAAAYTTAISYLVMFVMHWSIAHKLLKKYGIKRFFKLKIFSLVGGIIVLWGYLVLILNPYPIIKYCIFILGCILCVIIFRKQLISTIYQIIKKN